MAGRHVGQVPGTHFRETTSAGLNAILLHVPPCLISHIRHNVRDDCCQKSSFFPISKPPISLASGSPSSRTSLLPACIWVAGNVALYQTDTRILPSSSEWPSEAAHEICVRLFFSWNLPSWLYQLSGQTLVDRFLIRLSPFPFPAWGDVVMLICQVAVPKSLAVRRYRNAQFHQLGFGLFRSSVLVPKLRA